MTNYQRRNIRMKETQRSVSIKYCKVK